MMAAGLPVVELGLENNLYDLPETACLLSSADGASLSGAICELLADPGQSTPFSDAGVRFMSSRDEARENAAFVAAVRSILSGSRPDAPVPREINTREPFRDPEPSLLPVGRDVRFRDRVRRRLAR
jgi:hypothetical protein